MSLSRAVRLYLNLFSYYVSKRCSLASRSDISALSSLPLPAARDRYHQPGLFHVIALRNNLLRCEWSG
jgi:hypothetical protein